jgi:hypothetical protein
MRRQPELSKLEQHARAAFIAWLLIIIGTVLKALIGD